MFIVLPSLQVKKGREGNDHTAAILSQLRLGHIWEWLQSFHFLIHNFFPSQEFSRWLWIILSLSSPFSLFLFIISCLLFCSRLLFLLPPPLFLSPNAHGSSKPSHSCSVEERFQMQEVLPSFPPPLLLMTVPFLIRTSVVRLIPALPYVLNFAFF